MVGKALNPEKVNLQQEAKTGLRLRCTWNGRQRVRGTSRSSDPGEAKIKLGASAGGGDPRSSV